jgi:hypothetical protein
VKAASGTVGAPGFTFTGDTDTGLYEGGGANTLSITAAGTEVLRATSSGVQVNGQLFLPSGTSSLPGGAFASDTTTGAYLAGAGVLGIAAGATKTATFSATTTSNATCVTTLSLFAGENSGVAKFKGQTTTSVSTVATTIHQLDELCCMVLVSGNNGTDYFMDLVIGMNGGSATSLGSRTIASPANRTYTVNSNSNLQLAMASGTYSISTASLQLKAR